MRRLLLVTVLVASQPVMAASVLDTAGLASVEAEVNRYSAQPPCTANLSSKCAMGPLKRGLQIQLMGAKATVKMAQAISVDATSHNEMVDYANQLIVVIHRNVADAP